MTTIECPSGLVGEIRGLKGKEARLMTDLKGIKQGQLWSKILKGCWLNTVDPGPYTINGSGQLDWSEVLLGDRFFAILKIREETYGSAYEFSAPCSNNACREKIDWEIRIDELPVKTLSQEVLDEFKNGNKLCTTVPPDDKKVWFKLLVGADEVKISKAVGSGNREGALITGLALRIVEIEGVNKQDKRKYLEDLEMADLLGLVDAFDESDGGIETEIEIECQECFWTQEIELPFGRAFFMPSKKGKANGG